MRERTPLATWDHDGSPIADLIYFSRLDGRYQVEVQSDSPDGYSGTLVIFDHNDGDKLIFAEAVPVSFGAIFGPDVADVNFWCAKAIEVVDGLNGPAHNS